MRLPRLSHGKRIICFSPSFFCMHAHTHPHTHTHTHTHTTHTYTTHTHTHTHTHTSLGTRPSKNQKRGSGKLAGVEVYTVPGMQAFFQLAFD